MTGFTFTKAFKIYMVFVVLFSGYLYLQLNGIRVFNNTQTEHEGQDNTYGNSRSGHHSHYYHK